MPARVRLRIACVESTGSEREHAAMISASVTFSHLQTTFSSGDTPIELISSLVSGENTSPSSPLLGMMIGARFGLNLGSFGAERPASARRSTTIRAMAGEPAMPGESIPAAWMKLPSLGDRSMIQSPRDDLARAPEKEWMDSLVSKEGTRRRHWERIVLRMSAFESGSCEGAHLDESRLTKRHLMHRMFCLPPTSYIHAGPYTLLLDAISQVLRRGFKFIGCLSRIRGLRRSSSGEDRLEDARLRIRVLIGARPLVDVARRRAEDQVAPERLLHQDALAERAGDREQDVVAHGPLGLAQKDVLADARFDLERVIADHRRDLVREATRAVDHILGPDSLLRDFRPPACRLGPGAPDFHLFD
mmetsp:Transcript_32724/g.74600  ORF Transcript_32724/g.74600 Transcript_32724/m.74600 type:complete len:360 (+) Transcript_32724:254-1333(+)